MHTATISRIATDAAGRWAVTASHDKTARVWDVATGRLVRVLRPPQGEGNEGKLGAVALSPDGRTVAVGGWTGYEWDSQNSIYLFGRADGRLVRRLTGLPNVILHLAFSPDGRWLAASLWGNSGVRVFDSASGTETGRDVDYVDDSYGVQFSADSRRLLIVGRDGQVRVYPITDGRLGKPNTAHLALGRQPYAARFSANDRLIAVGFGDSTAMLVLNAKTLEEVARPDTRGVDSGDLANVAWSADGRYLFASGRWNSDVKHYVRRWATNDWSSYHDFAVANNTVMDLVSLPRGGILFAAGDPAWGIVGPDLRIAHRSHGGIADLRHQENRFGVSPDARRLRFGYDFGGEDPRTFNLQSRTLGPDDRALATARNTAPGLDIRDWANDTDPKLDGRQLALCPDEISRSLAIAPDGQGFVLGTEWSLRRFNRRGKPVWAQPVPSVAWAVNWSPDTRFIVAGYGDGTIRWHRASDGQELLAFFPHADRKRWVAWTPEGFYAASGPDAESLMGYHLNDGKDREGRFVSAAQLRERFYQPELISRRLDPDGDRLIAQAVAELGDVREVLAGPGGRPPVVELLSPARVETDGEVQVRIRVRDQGGGILRTLYRIDGTEIAGRPAGTFADGTESRTFTLPPAARPREAEIAVSAQNREGVESAPVVVKVQVRPGQAPKPALWLLAVGVSEYRDASLHAGVRFAAADARAMETLFRERGPGLFAAVHTKVLPDGEASGDAIRAELRRLAGEIGPQDVFVLYLAGHGKSFEGEYGFIPWDAVYTSPRSLRERSLERAELQAMLAEIRATKTVLLIDTCSAGSLGAALAARGMGDKEAIERFSRLSGRATLAATASDRVAIEGEGGHGAFTFALLKGLKGAAERSGNGVVEVRELADYVEDELPRITRKWGFEQFPFSSIEGNTFALLPKR